MKTKNMKTIGDLFLVISASAVMVRANTTQNRYGGSATHTANPI